MVVWHIFKEFLLLGCYAFGGPVAHIGYFRRRFVQQQGWLNDAQFGSLVAMSQVLPGPSSSQLGFAIGHHRGGLMGAVAAFLGFTLPSFILMTLLAIWAWQGAHPLWLMAVIQGLKLLAMVVILDALFAMAKQFCTQTLTQALAVASAAIIWVASTWGMVFWAQMLVLAFAALIGAMRLPPTESKPMVTNTTKPVWPMVFVLVGVTAIAVQVSMQFEPLSFVVDYFRAGALVFGGGHVVVPMLYGEASGLTEGQFLMAYGAAQVMPGPMFTLASFAGATLMTSSPWIGAALATLAIFLPGLLLMLILKSGWQGLSRLGWFNGAVVGINAAVVGLLAAAVYQPVFISTVASALDMAYVVVGVFLLRVLKVPIVLLVVLAILAGLWA